MFLILFYFIIIYTIISYRNQFLVYFSNWNLKDVLFPARRVRITIIIQFAKTTTKILYFQIAFYSDFAMIYLFSCIRNVVHWFRFIGFSG